MAKSIENLTRSLKSDLKDVIEVVKTILDIDQTKLKFTDYDDIQHIYNWVLSNSYKIRINQIRKLILEFRQRELFERGTYEVEQGYSFFLMSKELEKIDDEVKALKKITFKFLKNKRSNKLKRNQLL